MALATVRTDGWPQVTTVGFLAEDFDLVFVAARTSQKVANLTSDDRAAAALRLVPPVGPAIAGDVTDIADPADITCVSDALARRAPHAATFCPAGGSVAVLRLRAEIVSASPLDSRRAIAVSTA